MFKYILVYIYIKVYIYVQWQLNKIAYKLLFICYAIIPLFSIYEHFHVGDWHHGII